MDADTKVVDFQFCVIKMYVNTIQMSYLAGTCDCSGVNIQPLPAQCQACGWLTKSMSAEEIAAVKNGIAKANQRRIWNAARVPSSLFTMNLAALNVVGGPKNMPIAANNYVNWNQASDRAVAGIVPASANIPRRRTRAIPGQTSAPGKGVDVKHNSYARYLNRKKGKIVRTTAAVTPPVQGNKTQSLGLVAGCDCLSN
mgnify:FL=1